MKKGEKKSLKKENINYKKLFFELMIILAILFATTLIVLLPILEKHGALEKNIYGEYAGLIKEVDDYDYSKGRNRELESKIEEVWNKGTINKRFYFYGLARAVYFCNIGYYNTANETFSEIKLVVPESENDELEFDLDARAVLCERKQNES